MRSEQITHNRFRIINDNTIWRESFRKKKKIFFWTSAHAWNIQIVRCNLQALPKLFRVILVLIFLSYLKTKLFGTISQNKIFFDHICSKKVPKNFVQSYFKAIRLHPLWSKGFSIYWNPIEDSKIIGYTTTITKTKLFYVHQKGYENASLRSRLQKSVFQSISSFSIFM